MDNQEWHNIFEYEYTDKCREISGFGSGYENLCRSFVIRSMEWFDENPDAHPNNNDYKYPSDIANSKGEALADELMLIDDSCTGAQLGYSVAHAVHAAKIGWDNYIKEMEVPYNEK